MGHRGEGRGQAVADPVNATRGPAVADPMDGTCGATVANPVNANRGPAVTDPGNAAPIEDLPLGDLSDAEAQALRIALEEVWGAVRLVVTLAVLATLEFYSRILGAYDYRVKKQRHVVWDMAWTTKDPGQGVGQQESPAETGQHVER